MATIGDPLMDLGGALAYWVQADDDEGMQRLRRQPSDRPGMLTRAEIVEHYRERTDLHVDDWMFYEVFGLFRLAVILQQIWYRYVHGQTTNPTFREFSDAVGYLETRCRRLIAEHAS
jgi:aminoglycoside phosphotransferase (APT) family kinase protein